MSASTVTYNNVTLNYATYGRLAVNYWNAAVNSSSTNSFDINLTSTSNGNASTTRVVISPLDRGATGWYGFTYYYNYNSITGNWTALNPGGYPAIDYQSGTSVANIYYLQTAGATVIQNVIMHEMGHIFGLMHSGNTSAVMYEHIASVTSLRKPQTDDINGVKVIYQ